MPALGAGGREFESRYPDKVKVLKINGLQHYRSCKSLIFLFVFGLSAKTGMFLQAVWLVIRIFEIL